MSSAGSDIAGSDSGSSELDEFLQTMLADGNAMVGLILQQQQQRRLAWGARDSARCMAAARAAAPVFFFGINRRGGAP